MQLTPVTIQLELTKAPAKASDDKLAQIADAYDRNLREELISLARPVQQRGVAWLEATTPEGAVRAFEVSFGSVPPAVTELRPEQWTPSESEPPAEPVE